MADNKILNAEISDEEWNKVEISNVATRPNQKSAYGQGLSARDTKKMFAAPSKLLKDKHNELVDALGAIGQADAERTAVFEEAQRQRESDFSAAQEAMRGEFDLKQSERQAQYEAWYDELEIVQTPGDSEASVMSQKGVTDLAKQITEYIDVTYTPAKEELMVAEGYITLSGALSLNSNWMATDYISVNKNTAITGEVYGAATISTVAFYDDNKTFISSICGSGAMFTINTAPPENAKYVRLTLLKAHADNGIRIVKLLEAVSKESITQEYGDSKEKIMSQEAVTKFINDRMPMAMSRNLLNVTLENAHIDVNTGIFYSDFSGDGLAAAPEYISVIGGESYTMSWLQNDVEAYPFIIMYDTNKTYMAYYMLGALNKENSGTFRLEDNCAYIRIYLYEPTKSTNWEYIIPDNLQLEQGEDVTPYVRPTVIDNTIIDAYDAVAHWIEFDWSSYGLPVLEFFGSTVGMNKDNAVTLAYKYGDREGSCTLKWQGSSSVTYPKKNYTIKFDTAFEAKEGWSEQKKYCLKANYIDFSHSRNICCAKLWGDVVKSRTPANETLNTLINGGAIDGFPICVVINRGYQGIYTFNIPKDGWMFGMGDGTSEAIVCADSSASGACTFEAYATLDGDFEVEYASDEDNTEWIKTSLNKLIQACIDSNGTDLDTTIAQYLDWESAVDYYVFCLLTQNYDGISKNYLLSTYDGTKWFFSAYDLDSTFGLWWNGSKFVSINGDVQCSVNSLGINHRVFKLIKTYKSDELKARYRELVNGVLSEEAVIETFTNFAASVPKALFDEEVRIWPTLPSTSVNNVSQIIDFYRRRRAYIDPQIEAL